MKFTNSLRTSLYTTVGALLLALSSFAQAPEKMSYQAVIRGANNALVTNQQVGMQISILQGSTAVYEETQTPTSNTNGLVSLEIGTGTVISGSFTAIDWSAGTYFIKTETDPTGGTNYTITGTSQLLSVPFALYAKTSSDAGAVAANTAKVGYTEAAVSANTDVAANTAKVGYTEAAVSANTDVAANTAKVGYTEALVSANTDVVANTAKVGYTDALVSANTDVAANTAKVGYTDALVSANTDVAANTAKVGYTEALVSANTDVAANTLKYSKNEVDTLIANLQTQITQITNNAISVGDFYQGGVVFYIFVDGDTGYVAGETHGLIAAVQDQSSAIRWYNGFNATTGATGTAIGTGSANTDAIINVQGPTETSYAAGLARAYTGGGHTDWFLPSKDELNKMYLNKNIINTTAAANSGSDFSANNYWSSTEYDKEFAWYQSLFSSGNQNYNYKYYTLNFVRAVRAF